MLCGWSIFTALALAGDAFRGEFGGGIPWSCRLILGGYADLKAPQWVVGFLTACKVHVHRLHSIHTVVLVSSVSLLE